MEDQNSKSDPSDEENDESLVCFCHCVSKKSIIQAIRDGADTFEKIQADLNTSTGCGGCEPDVKDLLAKYGPKSK